MLCASMGIETWHVLLCSGFPKLGFLLTPAYLLLQLSHDQVWDWEKPVPCDWAPLMFFEGSSSLSLYAQACMTPALRIDGRAAPSLSVTLAQGNQSIIYQLWQYSLYEQGALFYFPPSWPHLPISCTNKGKTYSLHWHLDKLVNVCSGSIG